MYNMYAQDRDIYREGKIITPDAATYQQMKADNSNDIVNKFGHVYATGTPLLLHSRYWPTLSSTPPSTCVTAIGNSPW